MPAVNAGQAIQNDQWSLHLDFDEFDFKVRVLNTNLSTSETKDLQEFVRSQGYCFADSDENPVTMYPDDSMDIPLLPLDFVTI